MLGFKRTLLVILFSLVAPSLQAQAGLISQQHSCAALQNMVMSKGKEIIRYNTGNLYLFELVYGGAGGASCSRQSSSGQCKPFRAPASDTSSCLIGYIETPQDDSETEEPTQTASETDVAPTPDPEPDPTPECGEECGS